MNADYDVAVIGAGPAGCTAAALTAHAGLSTLLVEREAVPRFHVGESLMPECYWTFERLGILDRLKRSPFVEKHSVQFVSPSQRESAPFYFREHDPRDCARTWQVERGEFDKLLFENAREKGADCFDRTRLTEVRFDGDRACGVSVKTADGHTRDIACRVVVDATGQQAFLANRLKLMEVNPDLKKAAIWGYYRNARRDEGDNAGATIILFTRSKRAWFWFIPLSNGITSIGVVSDNDYLLKRGLTPAAVYAQEMLDCPALVERLEHAEFQGEHHVAKEFSYTTRQHAGEGWVLIGDAFGFIDPVYSSGVFLALKSGELAADAIVEGFQRDDLSAAQLNRWTADFKAGMIWIRKLVMAYYDENFSLGQFIKQHPEHRGNLTDLLIGRVFYDGAGRIFDDMDPWIETAGQEKLAHAN